VEGKGVVRLGFGRIEGDSRCHIGSRDTSTSLCILYPPQSILGKNQVCRKVFGKKSKSKLEERMGKKQQRKKQQRKKQQRKKQQRNKQQRKSTVTSRGSCL